MDPENHARALVDGFAVIVEVGAIRGAHFAQHGAGALHDFGDAEPVADLDQFTARDHRFPARRQLVENQEQRGRAVVHYSCRPPEDRFQQIRHMHIALPALACGEVVLKIGVAVNGREISQRRASQIGVQYDAGGIDYMPVRRRQPRCQRRLDCVFDRRLLSGAFFQCLPGGVQCFANFGDNQWMGQSGKGRREALDHIVDGRQIA